MNFDKKYSNAKTIHLEKNYRSTQKILSLANEFISHNKDRLDKNLYSQNQENFPIKLASTQAQTFEAKYVAREIAKLIEEKKYKYRDIFVLYRINALSGNFERTFTNMKIPYQVVGGLNFRDRKVIKDISSMLLAVVSQDTYATERVIGNVPKVGATTVAKLETAALDAGMTIYNYLVQEDAKALTISKYLSSIINVFKEAKDMYENNSNV